MTGREASKDPGDGEIDFSDGELVEMNAAIAGRDPDAAQRKRRRSMLRVPADEVPRAPEVGSQTDRSLPAFPDEDPVDELVEHAFHNGGTAEGTIPAARLRLEDEEDVDGIEALDESLADEEPTDSAAMGDNDERAPRPDREQVMAALVRAVAEPPKPLSPWGEAPPPPPQSVSVSGTIETVLSSAPSPDVAAARLVSVATEISGEINGDAVSTQVIATPATSARGDDADGEELDGEDIEEVEAREPPAADSARARSLTPVVPPQVLISSATAPTPAFGIVSLPPAGPPPPAALPSVSTPPPAPAASAIAPSPGPFPSSNTPPPSPFPSSNTPPPTPAGGIAIFAGAPPPTPLPLGAAPPPAPAARPPVPAPAADALPARKKRRAKQWFEEIFDDDYLRTLPFLTPQQTEREAQFVADSLGVAPGGALLDLACGYGRHAMELTQKGYQVTGLDLSLPLLIRAADAARRSGLSVNFMHGDMRETTFDNEFDGAYCMFTSFGYFDDDTNRKVAANLARAIRPGGRLLLDLVNRDYLVRDVPTRVWWQGDGCVVLEEVDFNYFSSRLQVQRSIIFEDGRQAEQEISIRAYALHEIGKVLHHAGFRVTEVSGGLALRGRFFGAESRQLLVLAEKKGSP